MNGDLIGGIMLIAISIGVFLIFRGISLWYFKINERIIAQKTTNILLEKMLIQLGAKDIDRVLVKNVKTGNAKQVSIQEAFKEYNDSGYIISDTNEIILDEKDELNEN
jgi:hypothetical protein